MSKVIGIDLGTTFSVMAYVNGEKPCIIPNAEGKPLTPSAVGWDKENNVYVGESAHLRAMFDPDRTVLSIKRRMGSDYLVSINGRSYTPQEISAYILRKLKSDAEKYFEEEINHPKHMRIPTNLLIDFNLRNFGIPDLKKDINFKKIKKEKIRFCNFVYSQEVSQIPPHPLLQKFQHNFYLILLIYL